MSENEQANSEAILASFRTAGLARRYIDKTMKLSRFGAVGERLGKDFASGEMGELVRAGTCPVMVGTGTAAVDLQMLIIRNLILNRFHCRVVSLNALLEKIEAPEEDDESILRADVLGIMFFYEPEYPEGFSNQQKQVLGGFLYRHVANKRALVLQTPVPVMRCDKWWSVHLRELIEENSVVYEVPSGLKASKI